MFHRYLLGLFLSLLLVSCGHFGPSKGLVILDIGHIEAAQGAKTPTPVDGKTITELRFWYEYAIYVKEEIEDAGYECMLINRGNAPKDPHLRKLAQRAGIFHQQQAQSEVQRYPSRYFPDRVSRGIISADYAVFSKAKCIVFLHHNSTGRGWSKREVPGLLIYNKRNGYQLAESIGRTMEEELIEDGDFPHEGDKITLQTRSIDASAGAGWMNVCDDAGIPAVILEVAYLNNIKHARYLADRGNAIDYAEAVGDGVVDYLQRPDKKTPTKRRKPYVGDKGSFGYARESRKENIPNAKRYWN